ncbi:hypothetical protein DRN85_06895 [Methanosarcinales archaeon]|nr:MAG: hypothetical protein DRN85_06895 [Methanosarcinales archaeon]
MTTLPDNIYCKICYGPCVWMVINDTGYEYIEPGAFDDVKTYALRCQWCGYNNDVKRGSEVPEEHK